MKDTLKRLLAERANVWEGAKAVIDAAEAETRNLSADEQTEWDRRNADLDALDARITDLSGRIARETEAAEARAKAESLIRPAAEPQAKPEPSTEDRALAFFRGESRGALIVPAESRDLTKLSAGAGANTVPTSFRNSLYEHMVETAAIRTQATVLTTDSGEAIQVPKTTAHGSAALVAEADPIAESDPAFGQVTLNAYKYGVLIQLSTELISDTAVDLLGYVARQAGRALGLASGTHFATGDNSSKPNGIVPASTAGVTGDASVSGAFSAENLIDLYYSVIAPYRNSPNCAWIMRDATVAKVRKLREGAGTGAFLWQPSMQVGQPDTLLGKPIVVDPNIAAVALSAKSVIFGDIGSYFIRDVSGIRFERSDDYAFANDLVTFKCLLRTDGELIDTTGAVKHFVGNAA